MDLDRFEQDYDFEDDADFDLDDDFETEIDDEPLSHLSATQARSLGLAAGDLDA